MHWQKVEDGLPPPNVSVLTYWPGDDRYSPIFVVNVIPGANQFGEGRWWRSRPDRWPTHWAHLEGPSMERD